MTSAAFDVQSEELEGQVRVLVVRGELDMNTAPELETQLKTVVASDASILIDLSDCEFIDSTGIALIVRAWQGLDRDAGGEGKGRLVLSCHNHQVLRLLKITGVESSISMHERREDALAELRS